LGRVDRAKEILNELEKLRGVEGGVLDYSKRIPLEFDHLPAVAGTAWIELVHQEMARDSVNQLFFAEP
jgi:hypothetical protein